MNGSTISIDQARKFLALIDAEAEGFTFQTFDDDETLKRGHLAKVVHGDLEEEIRRLTNWSNGGAGVFVTINETDRMGRKAANITRVRAVFADLDGAPLAPVLTCALAPHIIVESSAGRYHAYWRVDGLPLDQFAPVQHAIATKFKGDHSCSDVSRVLRLPGFPHRKGEPFLTRIHAVNERLPYTAEEVLAEFPPLAQKANGAANNHSSDRDTDELIRKITTGEEYHAALRDLAFRFALSGISGAQITLTLRGLMNGSTGPRDDRWQARFKQIPDLVRTAETKLAKQRQEPHPAAELIAEVAEAETTDDASAAEDEVKGDALYDFSDDGLALDMGRYWQRYARHVALWGSWLFWTGTKWQRDEKLLHMTRTRIYLRARGDGIVRATRLGKIKWGNITDPEKAIAAAEALAKTLRAKGKIACVVDLARSNAELVAGVDDWDAHPWHLNTPDGIVDLTSGALMPHDPAAMMSKITAVGPGGDCPRWIEFLKRITDDNTELQDYLQCSAGYALTGSTREHALQFAYGTGANGKSVFLGALTGIMGEYAVTSPMETFTVTNSDRHPTELAMLRGARLVTSQETEQGRRWAESKVKSLTGGDPITARFMHKDFFTFIPQFKLFIAGNHRPGLTGVDEAMRRRMHLVPFTVTIPSDQRDRDLPEKLKAEWSGILAWMIRGCLAWQQQGLNPPAAVRAATDEYLSSEDAFESWRAECIEPAPHHWETSAALWNSWKRWAENAGEYVGTQKRFSQLLAERLFVPAIERARAKRRGFYGGRIVTIQCAGGASYAADM